MIQNTFGLIRIMLISLVIVNLFVHHPISAQENSPARPETVAESYNNLNNSEEHNEEASEETSQESSEKTNGDSSEPTTIEVPREATESSSLNGTESEANRKSTETDLEILLSGKSNSTSDQPLLLVFKILFYTILIIVMIYGLRKVLVIQQKRFQPNPLFQNLGGTPLGPNKSLQLVKVGGKVYLLGVADQVSLIKEIHDPEEISQLESNIEEETFIPKGIKELVQSKLTRRDQEESTQSTFHQLFNQSLENQVKKRKQLKHDLQAEEFNHKEGRSI